MAYRRQYPRRGEAGRRSEERKAAGRAEEKSRARGEKTYREHLAEVCQKEGREGPHHGGRRMAGKAASAWKRPGIGMRHEMSGARPHGAGMADASKDSRKQRPVRAKVHPAEQTGETREEQALHGRDRAADIDAAQQRIYKLVATGVDDDTLNRIYDVLSTAALLLNLLVSILMTFQAIKTQYYDLLKITEKVTVAFFAVDYVLRVFSAKYQYPGNSSGRAARKYCLSLMGIIDLLSFLPYYLPFFFPAGTAAFRLFRVARIFRLFRINAYYDSLNVITDVLKSKARQLLSSVFIILILMLASSLAMYSVEHDAQPDVFQDAFSGIWWAASTLLTVGYGDIYPVTTMGQVLAIAITFLGVLMVAIPTGIISAGFVEQYQKYKKLGDYAVEEDIHFIEFTLREDDAWVDRLIRNLRTPKEMLIVAIERNGREYVPWGNLKLRTGDKVIIAAESLKNEHPVYLKELLLKRQHPWVGQAIHDLDISRRTFIVMIRRGDRTIIPYGDLVLEAGDMLFLYSTKQISEVDHEVVEDI